MLVGNVISVSSLATRFTTSTTGLNSEFLASGLELVNSMLGPSWKINVDRCSHASAQVGWARVNIAKLGGQNEVLATLSLDRVSNSLNAIGQSLEDTLDITTLLHGDDTGLILLIDPDEESLGIIVENATALRPVTLHTGNLQVWVTRHEEEVIINELLTDLLIHTSQWVVVTSEFTSQLAQSRAHELLNTDTLFLGDARGQAKSLDGATDTDSDRVDWDFGVDVALDLGDIHVRSVFEVSWKTVVLTDEGIEDISKVNVGVLITGIDTTVLVVEFNSASDGLGEGEA